MIKYKGEIMSYNFIDLNDIVKDMKRYHKEACVDMKTEDNSDFVEAKYPDETTVYITPFIDDYGYQQVSYAFKNVCGTGLHEEITMNTLYDSAHTLCNFVNQELRKLKLGIDAGFDLDKTVDKLKEEKLVALVSKTYAKSGAIHGIRVRFNDGVIGDLCWPLFDKSCKCLMYRDEEAHSIGKFFSVFYISSEDMLPQYAADKFIDGYKRSVNL
jgi:hypothetical protein